MVSQEAIVISGCGWVTPFEAGSIDAVLTAAGSADRAGSDTTGYWPVPDVVLHSRDELTREVKSDKAASLTAIAVEYARRSARFDWGDFPPERIGFVLGCALAGQLGMIDFAGDVRKQGTRFVSPIHFPQTVGNYVAGAIARAYNLRGPNLTLASGEASSLYAIHEGYSMLANDQADLALVGGTEVSSPELGSGLAAPGIGFSEGACWFVLEHEASALSRGVQPLAKVKAPGHEEGEDVESTSGIISTGSEPRDGSVHIAHWIGRCPGAAGAAAAAAAIGAASGLEVPVVAGREGSTVQVRQLAQERDAPRAEQVEAVVVADRSEGQPMTLQLVIPTRR